MTNPRPFRFGAQLARPRRAVEWRAIAQQLEADGYDVFLMPDHFGRQFAIGPALAAVAAATYKLRIGTLVWQNDLRHPALLAQEVGTLDVLSDGRFEFGIGAGGSFPGEYEWVGIPFSPAGARVDRLAESLKALKALASDEPFSHSGTNFTFADYNGHPKPVQQPHPPILIAGGGKRMLTLAAQEADIVGLIPRMQPSGGFSDDPAERDYSFQAFIDKADFVREQAGKRADGLEFNLLVQMLVVTDDREKTIADLMTSDGIEDRDWFDSPMVFVGTEKEIAARFMEIRERIGISYFVVFEHLVEIFTPIMHAIKTGEAID